MKAYSTDLRDRVLAACDEGRTTKAVAEQFRVSASWVRRVKQVRRESGRTAPLARSNGPAAGWAAHAEAIREAVRLTPDATLAEHHARLALPLSRATLARALAALGLSRKKSRSGRVSRTGRT